MALHCEFFIDIIKLSLLFYLILTIFFLKREVRPREGSKQSVNKNSKATLDNGLKIILVENIPESWSPQLICQCFSSYGKITNCYIYDGQFSRQALIEMESSDVAKSLCKNTGFLLLPNNITVKVSLTSISNFSDWINQLCTYQQILNWSYMLQMGFSFNNSVLASSQMSNKGARTEEKDETSVSRPKELGAIVKASNVDMSAFKNSDEIFTTFKNIFGHAETPGISSISSDKKAVVIFSVPDYEKAKEANKIFDWVTFPGSVPEISFTLGSF